MWNTGGWQFSGFECGRRLLDQALGLKIKKIEIIFFLSF